MSAAASGVKLQNEELKDAYRAWLKDLHDDKPERLLQKLGKKKSDGGRRARRNIRMQHAQQHTATSALKDVALKKAEQAKLPALYVPTDKQVLHDARRRRHQILVDEASYSGIQYSHQPSWRPGLAFFQQLVHCLLPKGTKFVDESNGIASTEQSGFPIRIAPILFRVALRQSDRLGTRLGVALLYCQEQNQEEHGEHAASSSFLLVCRVYSQESSWREHRSALVEVISNPSAEICAVRKRADDFECRYNDLQFLRSRQDVEHAIDELWIDSANTDDTKSDYTSDLVAVQKYIPFKGATSSAGAFASTASMESPAERKAWIARCASRKRDKHSSTVWVISGGDAHNSEGFSSTLVTRSSSANCQLIKCTIDQAWSEPRLLASMCMISLEKMMQVRFSELVVDLLQDSSGNWWLLQVKAFSFASIRPVSAVAVSSRSTSSKTTQRGLSRIQSAPNRFDVGILPTPQWRKWRCAGRYCTSKTPTSDPANQESIDGDEHDDSAKEPPGYLTKKVLRSCEFFDDFVQQQDMSLAGGFTEFHSALAFHLQHRLPKRDRSQLYEPQPLCSACLRRYHSLRQQWALTVGTPKLPATSNIIAVSRQKAHSKSFNEYVDHPRKLPSLYHESGTLSSLYASYSAPALPLSINPQKSSMPEHETIEKRPKTYLDELAAMEEMLAEHEPPSVLVKTTSTSQTRKQNPSTVTTTATFTSLSSSPDNLFPKWDGETRIEAMWQNLALKPLERHFTGPKVDVNDVVESKNGYNSISLHQELTRAADLNETSRQNDHQVSPDMVAMEKELQNDEITKPACMKSIAAHAIPVQHCRQVFEDEVYREQLVSDAISALQSGRPNVCFVVAPRHDTSKSTSSSRQRPCEDEGELAEMALRSLYIDVKQAIVATSEEIVLKVPLSSWPMRPNVHREASGCMTVKLGPA